MGVFEFLRRGPVIGSLAAVVVAGSLAVGLGGTTEERFDCDGVSMTAAQIAAKRNVPLDRLPILAAYRDLSPRDICIMPEGKLKRALYKVAHPAPDHPADAVAWRNLRQRDEQGVIPLDGATRALEHLQAMPDPIKPAFAVAEGGVAPQQISATSWTSIGPGNVGGRIRSIAIDPTNGQKIWAGSVGGGLWKTVNGGTTWTSVSSFLTNMAVSSIVFNRVTPAVMYAGTGEGFYNGDGLRGTGILKSTDGGVHWARTAATSTADFQYVNRLAISPNGTVLLAATRTGIFRSTDAGVTWTKTRSGETLDLRFHPTSNTAAVAGGRNGVALRSADGGVTWTAATGLPTASGFGGRVELSYAPSNGAVVFASVDVNGGELYRSANGGASYTLKSTGKSYLGGQGWYANALWVSPKNPNLVMVGGLDLWRSANAGATLTQVSQWWSAPVSSAHADHHVIVAPPEFNGTTNTTVYFGNDGGIYKAANVASVALTTGWQELNNKFGITQFYSAAVNPTTNEVVGGTQDNGTLFYKPGTGSEAWTTTFGGDGGYSGADPIDPNYFYGEYVYLQIHRSTDRGVSASYIVDGLADADSCANFIAPFTLDPNLSTRMFAGGCRLWRSNDVKAATPSWTSIKPTNGNVPISAIAVAPGNSNIVWIGHNNGDVFKSVNALAATPTWTKVSTGLPGRYVNSIAISKVDANAVYVSLGGYVRGNVWKTANAGTTWTVKGGAGSTALPAAPVYSLVIHPNNAAILYAGTEVGVVYSEDDGATWHNNRSGPSATSVDQLLFAGTTLYAATHGRGIYKSATQ